MVRRFFSASSEEESPEGGNDEVVHVDRQVIQFFALVEEAVAGATHALLAGDREAARRLVAEDAALDDLYRALAEKVTEQIMAGGLSPSRKRWLLALFAMLPELERSGDLAEHVAQRATRTLEMPARVRGFIEEMGEVVCSMWKMAADAYADRAASTEAIEQLDDRIDDLHVQLIGEIASGSVPVQVAIELALVGRFYERLGDHAVNVARRVPTELRSQAIG